MNTTMPMKKIDPAAHLNTIFAKSCRPAKGLNAVQKISCKTAIAAMFANAVPTQYAE